MKKIIALFLAVAAVLSLAACGTQTPETEPVVTEPVKQTIHVLAPAEGEDWLGAVGAVARQTVEDINEDAEYAAQLHTYTTAQEQAEQIRQLTAGYDGTYGLVILPAGAEVELPMRDLADRGVPFITVEETFPSVSPFAVSHLQYSDTQIGAAAAAYLVAMGMEEGKKVVLLEGSGSAADAARTEGFRQYLLGNIAYEGQKIETPWTSLDSVVYSGPIGETPAEGKAWFEGYMEKTENARTRYLTCWNEALALGVFEALNDTVIPENTRNAFVGTKPVLTACGGTQVFCNTIAGDFTAYPAGEWFNGIMSIPYSPEIIRTAALAMEDYMELRYVPQDNTLSAVWVHKNNVYRYEGY